MNHHGWRFVNKKIKELYGVDSMPETAENVATDDKIGREAQDKLALASQLKELAAQKSGFFHSDHASDDPAEQRRCRCHQQG